MGRGYNRQLHHGNLQLHYKSIFLPMLCSRPSMEDVAIPRLEDRSMSFSTDPLSPKIGCMGQVKRNNKIIGFPMSATKLSFITATKTETNTTSNVKYSKLRRIFSAKSLTSTGNSTSSTTITGFIPEKSCSCRWKEGVLSGASGPKIHVSIEDMDPPLPVVKKVVQKQVDGEVGSLWKRRSGGVELKGLQLQQNQVNRQQLAPTKV